MACLLENEPASVWEWQAEGRDSRRRSESESEKGEKSLSYDTKPGELTMSRLKAG
jgi:hypothetical protein